MLVYAGFIARQKSENSLNVLKTAHSKKQDYSNLFKCVISKYTAQKNKGNTLKTHQISMGKNHAEYLSSYRLGNVLGTKGCHIV